jgi:hypothetical protein
MATTSLGYSITVRAEAPPTIGATADLAAAVMAAGGSLTTLDVLESGPDLIVVDVTCDATDAAHADEVTDRSRNCAQAGHRAGRRRRPSPGRSYWRPPAGRPFRRATPPLPEGDSVLSRR